MRSAYSSKAVANYFLEKSDPPAKGKLTQMKLHKLVYFAHGICLAVCNKPLIQDEIQAWQYGPVIPELYHEFRQFGANIITRTARDIDYENFEFMDEPWSTPRISDPDKCTQIVLDWVWEKYGVLSAAQLSTLTHQEGSPWEITRRKYGDKLHVQIPDEVIEEQFKKQLK